MSLHPILSSLRNHRVAASLIVLEIAFSCAVVCNALFLIDQRLERMHRPSGVAEQELVQLRTRSVVKDGNSAALTQSDLDALRRIPGVRDASSINMALFGDSIGYSGVSLQPDQERSTLHAVHYFGDAHLLDTLGLRLIAGRGFRADEFVDEAQLTSTVDKRAPPAVILSQALAQRLFPGRDAVGRKLYVFGEHRVVGVVERLVQPRDMGAESQYDFAMLFPVNVASSRSTYLLRVRDPAQREAVLRQAKAVLQQQGPRRMVRSAKTLEQARADYYRSDQAMAWLLVGVSAALLLVTALGIVGLTSFWVQQRTKQIGIRRALGATCTQILRHFQLENFLLASTGIVLGMLLAYAANLYLMSAYELPRLPLWYLPVGAVVLWLLGQLAVLPPARRAAAVPPAVATRSV